MKRACADFNNPRGPFARGEDYVFAMQTDGTQLAFALDPGVVGKNNADDKDPGGKAVGREILKLAREQGFGWVDYLFRSPVTGEIAPKSAYVEAVEGIVIGCGIYAQGRAVAHAEIMRPRAARPAPRLVPAPRLSRRA